MFVRGCAIMRKCHRFTKPFSTPLSTFVFVARLGSSLILCCISPIILSSSTIIIFVPPPPSGTAGRAADLDIPLSGTNILGRSSKTCVMLCAASSNK
eukprot:scaffold3176_cov82-Skeletonema_menzelii.AAC.1